jgi:hypothetical protein
MKETKIDKLGFIDTILLNIMFSISTRFYNYCIIKENKCGSTLFFTNRLPNKLK